MSISFLYLVYKSYFHTPESKLVLSEYNKTYLNAITFALRSNKLGLGIPGSTLCRYIHVPHNEVDDTCTMKYCFR